MYKIKVSGSKVQKKFKKAIAATKDSNGNSYLIDLFKNFPKGNELTHKHISKKMNFWNYDLSWGDRITYKVYDDLKTVVIYFTHLTQRQEVI